MRRLLTAITQYLAHLFKTLAEGWNTFWYTPADPTLLGAIRILTGLMLVYTHVVWSLDLEAFFSSNAWLVQESIDRLQEDQFVFSFWWWIPDEGIWYAHVTAVAILVLFTVGLLTRVTSILAFIITVSYAYRVPSALFGLDQINAMLTLYLAVGPSGRALSVDRLIARFRQARRELQSEQADLDLDAPPSASANVALRLIQLHMCVIYFFAGISKLQGPSWWDGEAMWLAFANLEYQSTDMTWLVDHPWLINAMSHATVFWEVSFCVLIWSRLWRPLMLFFGILMHVGIGACLGMWTFGLIMLVGCSSFLSLRWVRQEATAWLGFRVPLTFFSDQTVPAAHWVTSCVKALDVSNQVCVIDTARPSLSSAERKLVAKAKIAPEAKTIHLLTPTGPAQGFDALKQLARLHGGLWPIAWLCILPGSDRIGRWLYNTFVAAPTKPATLEENSAMKAPSA